MSGMILRIDDRLVHGQVVIGWGVVYQIEQYAVVSDNIANSEWEADIMRNATSGVETVIHDFANGVAYINAHHAEPASRMVLVESLEDFQKIATMGLQMKTIDVGGIHYTPGSAEYLSYLFLTKEAVQIFRELMAMGFTFYCQDMPTNTRYDLARLLEREK